MRWQKIHSAEDTGLWLTTVATFNLKSFWFLCGTPSFPTNTKNTHSTAHCNPLIDLTLCLFQSWVEQIIQREIFFSLIPFLRQWLASPPFLSLSEELFRNQLFLYSVSLAISNSKVRVELYAFLWSFPIYSRNTLGKYYVTSIVSFAVRKIKVVWYILLVLK